MPISYDQPRWIGPPADPAAHYAQGFQLGVHLGATQAAQMYQQQQLDMQRQHDLMAAQEQMVEKAYQSQVLGMKAQEMARKHQANYEFRSRVASGEDPSQVLMELAPELGENPATIIHDRALESQAADLANYRRANMQRLDQASQERLAAAKEARENALAEKKSEFEKRQTDLEQNRAEKAREKATQIAQAKSRLLLSASKDPEIMAIDEEIKNASAGLEDKSKIHAWFGASDEELRKQITDLKAKRISRLKDFAIENGLEDALPGETPIAAAAPGVAGDNTMPDTATSTNRIGRFTILQ